jgi:hypothetical protein
MFATLTTNAKPVAAPAALDNAIVLAYVGPNPHAKTVLLGIHAQYDDVVTAFKTITLKTGPGTPSGLLDAVTLAIGSTDTRVSTTAFHYACAGKGCHKVAVAAGTVLEAGTVPADTWGLWRGSIAADGTITFTAAADNTTGYASEALAIAVLPATPSGETDLGYLTVLTASGQAFIPGTDALQGGASGNPSSDTNYYAATALTLTTVGFPVRWDFTNGAFFGPLPGLFVSEHDQAVVVELEASGDGGIAGELVLWVAAP